jgi:tetratricopeptide (TPR) repeat protein
MKRRFDYSILIVAILFSVLPSHACMNDRDSDSLAEEGRDLPDVVRVITGRFERNPPLFYQMRVARVQQEIRSQPRAFNLYDDISVALDRLGRSDEAIEWIEKKRSLLPPFNAQDRVLKEHWYRYYANGGTFWAHRWLRAGANRKQISQMVRARDMIARAIHIKPDAHFGREKYQLAAMNWIIKPGQYADVRRGLLQHANFARTSKQDIAGLSGLVVLGNAWESVDVFNALAQAIQRDDRRSSLAYLARLRTNELIASGHNSLFPNAPQGKGLKEALSFISAAHRPNNKTEVEDAYKVLRADAEQWQATRKEYMMTRLQTGRHPDTDKAFWNEYSSNEPPTLEQFTSTPRWWRVFTSGPYLFLFTVFSSCIFLLFLRDLRRKRRLKQTVAL